jgi:cbb3-type cytochrome oxidase subunit 3
MRMCVILAVVFGTLGMPELMVVLTLLVWIALLFWVYRDASRRGMNAGLWVVIVFFLHLLGIIVYLIARGTRAK